MICEVFYLPIKTDLLFFLRTGLVSQEYPRVTAHVGDGGWSWAGGEMDDAPVITGEVQCGASDELGAMMLRDGKVWGWH